MRPGAEILDEFYGLVEADPTKRYNAVGRLVLKARAESTALDYCIERLITGLSSPRGAARFGYSAALVILLSEFHDSWTVERLFALAAKKLDLSDKESGSANAIGRHLLVSAIVQSKAYSKVETELIEKELEIYRSFPVLGMSIVQMIADIASEMEKKRFKSGVLPLIKNYLDTAVTSTNVEFIYLALLLKDKFPSYISESISFIQKDGSCKFSVSDLTFLLLVVKKCDSSALAPFLKLLMVSSRASGQFVDVYRNVVEKWCTTGDESKVLERIFDTAKLTLSTSSAAHEEVLAVFSPFLLKRITQAARGKQTPQYRVVRGKISEFCKFVEEHLADLKDDAAIIDVINALDAVQNFDSLTGGSLIVHLVGKLSREGVSKWLQAADQPWSIRHVSAAFPHWSNEAKGEALTNLLQRPKSEELQYAVGNCIDSMFRMKVRAGELVNVSLIEGGQDVLRHAAIAVCGKEVVKPVLKKLNSCEFDEGTFPVFWLCLTLWSKMASSEEISEGYVSNADELVSVAEGGETNIKILLDQLLGLLSQPMKYHRTVVYFVYVHLLSHLKKEHVAHIVETLMMDDEELADGDGSDGNSSNDDEEMEEDADAEPESENDDDENIDPETIDRLESALGKAAVKRKHDAVDEEESDESEVDDSEMFAMDERLAAAFKAMAPKKENKVAAQLASAFRLKLADLLLFTLSSQSTAPQVKACLIIPLLKLAKLQLKQDAEGQCARKTIGLLNIISRLKKIELSDKKVINLLNELISEGTGISNPTLIAAVAALSAFIFSLGISSEGTCSEAVLKEFLSLFERFMSQEDGLIGCELAIAAVIKHPEFFVSSANVFLKAGFNDEYRVFRKTEALLCLAGMINKGVLSKAAIEKSTVKGLAKASSEYLLAALAQPETIKPRYFASVMKLLQCTTSSVGDDLKPTLQKHLRMEEIAENEDAWKNVHKKVNSACQQVCGKSSARVIDGILKSVV